MKFTRSTRYPYPTSRPAVAARRRAGRSGQEAIRAAQRAAETTLHDSMTRPYQGIAGRAA